MGQLATVTIDLLDPVEVAGRTLRSVTLREPLAGDYVAVGPVLKSRRRGAVSSSFELFEVIALYVRRGIVGLSEHEADVFLAALPLADTFRLVRALTPLIPSISQADVRFFQSILVFDWRAMTIREADAMGVEELFYTVERLGEHTTRRASQRSAS